MRQFVLLLLSAILVFSPPLGAMERLASPAPVEELSGPLEIIPGTSYDPAVPTPDTLLGFPLGSRAATPEEIVRVVQAWDGHPRVKIVEYARSWEGRPLHYVVVTSPANQARLEAIKAGMARLGDPRGLADGEAQRLMRELPGVAWLAYSIHGNESSGSDASLAVLHHLIAGTDPAVTTLLDEVVVIIDPMMNPDGRARFTHQAAQHRGAAPNFDDQSLLRTGSWPWGRGNHYLFDLNRDWTLGIHPETRGRIRAVSEWRPLLFVDAHEMGSQDTYLFSPQREPKNPHTPESRARWSALFARNQAEAFDQRGWAYYTGEWNEGWYPGYSDAWATFRGAVGILYEQARVGEDAVRRPGGGLLTYRRAVTHQAVSSLANIETVRRNRQELLADFLAERRRSVAAEGPYANRTFAVLPTANRTRLANFAGLLQLQSFELFQLPRATQVEAVDAFGRNERRTLPAGTLLIPNRQPEAPLVATMLELDRHLPADYVERERQEILRRGNSTIYDLTSWSAPLLHGLETVTLASGLPPGATPYNATPPPPVSGPAANAVAWIVDGADDASVGVAARLLERGFEVRVAAKPFELENRGFAPGSVLVARFDNSAGWENAGTAMREIAGELGAQAVAVSTGLGEGDLPDLGGGYFQRLETPRLGLVARGGTSIYDFGATWLLIDRDLGIRHTHLDEDRLASYDLRRYNVLVLPGRWFGTLAKPQIEALSRWVEAGGTLIAMGETASLLAKEEGGISKVRLLPDVLEQLDVYEAAVLREHAAATVATPSPSVLWSHQAPTEVAFPWPADRPARPAKEELERRDAWQQQFMPSGAILAGRVDTNHWLTFGSSTVLPLLTGRQPVLMAAHPVEAPVRFGVLRGQPRTTTAPATPSRAGWSLIPAGAQMDLRMSGLLWPEAAHRLASSAWVTRERLGRGQVILFASSPSFRASTPAAARVLFNALVYGPGFGTEPLIVP
jgi:hypothetical protein